MTLTEPRPTPRRDRLETLSELTVNPLAHLTLNGASHLAEVRRCLRREEKDLLEDPVFLVTQAEIRTVVEQQLREVIWSAPRKTPKTE